MRTNNKVRSRIVPIYYKQAPPKAYKYGKMHKKGDMHNVLDCCLFVCVCACVCLCVHRSFQYFPETKGHLLCVILNN